MPNKASKNLAVTKVLAVKDMPVTRGKDGTEKRLILPGSALLTGETINMHQSVQPPGTKADITHATHHSEFMLVEDGTLALDYDGKTQIAGPGSMIYIAYNAMHRVRTLGDKTARYIVIDVGGDSKK